MNDQDLSRDDLAALYLDQMPFEPYQVQEEALLAWFTSKQGVLVCAPTGMGKTLIAEAAMFEALHTGQRAYYTTPLIALTEQKFREMQNAAVKWGFSPDDVGLVTGNRRENPDATVLVVVAEILLNRLLHGEEFDFDDVNAVVMDEFHSFADRERGIVWELALGLLPAHVRTLLLSATVGNAVEFTGWLSRNHNRRLDLVRSDQRRVPLEFEWVGDQLLTEKIEEMAQGEDVNRRTPALVFCFNREQCWNVAEQIKGKKIVDSDRRAALLEEIEQHDWSGGAGPKLKQLLVRGVGVHHAGVLPRYRRIVEDLFQKKLLSIATCTETLAAGINLPARSVVVPEIIKGPPGKKRIIEASTAHQIFGRAGRPQFDTRGYVFALAHEDDVKISRWREQYDQIPEKTKDPGLMKQKKRLKKKMPKRRENQQYWTEGQFEKLCAAPPGNLSSNGSLPWRLLAYMLDASPEVKLIRELVSKRLLNPKKLERAQKDLEQMLMVLWRAGYVELEPAPPVEEPAPDDTLNEATPPAEEKPTEPPAEEPPTEEATGGFGAGLFSNLIQESKEKEVTKEQKKEEVQQTKKAKKQKVIILHDELPEEDEGPPPYRPELAHPTPTMSKLLKLRGINPLYGLFLVNQLGIANREERIQAIESVLELPGSVAHFVRVPRQDELPRGPLATERLDEQLLRMGLATAEELVYQPRDEDEPYQPRRFFDDEPTYTLTLAQKLRMLFDHDFPGVYDLRTSSVWAAGEVLEFGGDFNKYVTNKKLQKQEGVVFRHLLRMILLIGELTELTPPDITEDAWRADMDDLQGRLTFACRSVDPTSTHDMIERAKNEAEAADV